MSDMTKSDETTSEQQLIDIEVAYALPEKQALISEQVPKDSTIAEALALSRIHQLVEGLEIKDGMVGIFSKVAKMTHVLQAGERIEIYRPLINDPKEARRRKAEAAAKATAEK